MQVNYRQQHGFSIMEIVVIVFVIAMGLVGVLALIVQNIQVQYINKNMIIASQLAQEGLELVRGKRDSNWFRGDDWKLGGGDSNMNIVQDGHYTIDYKNNINGLINSLSESDARLKIDANNFYRHYGGGTVSPFFRLIEIQDNGDKLGVKATVRWQDNKGNHDYVAETELYNWW